jgi:hypothetical protein
MYKAQGQPLKRKYNLEEEGKVTKTVSIMRGGEGHEMTAQERAKLLSDRGTGRG